MKEKIILVALAVIFSPDVFSQAPDWLWAKLTGGTSRDYGRSIAVDASGNIYSTGHFVGTVDFDPGPGTFNLFSGGGVAIFISKLDGSGNFIWAKAIVGSKGDCFSIALDAAGNVYTTGYFAATADFDPGAGTFNLTATGIVDMFICKLDGTGNFVWAKAMHGTVEVEGRDITVGASGDVYTTGFFSGTVDFDPGAGVFNFTSAGMHDIFISRLDNSGNLVWAKQIGGTSDDWGYSIAIEPGGGGDVYTTGFFKETVDFDPDSSGNFSLTSAGGYDIFISKLNGSGNFLWAKGMGGTGNYDFGYSIAFDYAGSGDVYTTGLFSGTVDFDPGPGVFNLTSSGYTDIFISKLNSSGNFIWAKGMGGTGGDAGYTIAVDPAGSGDVYTAGYFEGTADLDPGAGTFNLTSAGYTDIFISRLDGSGNFAWAKAVGGTEPDYCEGIALDASANVHVTGYFFSPSVTFSSSVLINASSGGDYEDLFIAKLDHRIITGIENAENNNDVFVYPNPSSNVLNIQNNSAQSIQFSCYNSLGEKIFSQSFTDQINTLDLSGCPAGIYFYEALEPGNKITTGKIIKQ